jgi:holo-[acyl-carrier protein] synthase
VTSTIEKDEGKGYGLCPFALFQRVHIILESLSTLEYDTPTEGSMTAPGLVGVGIDLVSVPRIEAMLRRWGERFLGRIFTSAEIEYCLTCHSPARSFAARFAAKEAFIKAVYRRRKAGMRYKDIEVVVGPDGRPGLRAHGTAKAMLAGSDAAVSLSHEEDLAVAVVVTSGEVTA